MGKSVTSYDSSIADRAEKLNSTIRWMTLVPAYEASAIARQDLKYPDFTHEVNKGALFLDNFDPGWYERLDLSLLDLDDQKSCILGQSWHHYQYAHKIDTETIKGKTGFDKFLTVIAGDDEDRRLGFAQAHGFALHDDAYTWINGTAASRWHDERGTYTASSPTEREIWDEKLKELEDSVWEQLTLTWVMLIKARQAVQSTRMPGRVTT